MSFKKFSRTFLALSLFLLAVSAPQASAQNSDEKPAQKKSGKKKSGKKKEVPTGTPVLWRDPGDISARDLAAGPGGEEMKPDLSLVTYLKPETGGYSVKYRVKDGAGKTWVAKVGNEARPEAASLRLVAALGYMTEINYLVPCVKIPGAPPPARNVPRCAGGGFADARFEARPKGIKRLETWSWSDNPFVHTREFKGLIVVMGLLNNWDLKDDNNKVLFVKNAGGQNELRYIISDLGATFGKTGGFLSRSRNEPNDYAKAGFVKGVENGRVRFNYGGKSGFLFDDIRVEDARWIASLLARLSDRQITDALRAANFKPEEVQTLAAAVRSRIDELVRVTGATPAALPTETTAAKPTPAPPR